MAACKMTDYSQLPDLIKKLPQWALCFDGKKNPIVRNKSGKGFTLSGWQDPKGWLGFDEALEIREKNRKCTGIGMLMKHGQGFVGGDIDCCVNPETGEIGKFAADIIKKIEPIYTEYSSSQCGLRFIAPTTGLPKLTASHQFVFEGPDDLSDECKANIIKIKGEKARFNGVELYEGGVYNETTKKGIGSRFLVFTGKKIPELSFPDNPNCYLGLESVIHCAIRDFKIKVFGTETIEDLEAERKKPRPQDVEAEPQKTLHIDILKVIDTTGPDWHTESGQLAGPHPTLGSSSGHNLLVNIEKNSWAYMHDGLNRGGSPLDFIACMKGIIKWEEAGSGALRGKKYWDAVDAALELGYVTEEQVAELKRPVIPTGVTVISCFRALSRQCDGATSKDGKGFSKWDIENYKDLIDKILSEDFSEEEEKAAYRIAKKHEKQLLKLGVDVNEVTHVFKPTQKALGANEEVKFEPEKFDEDIETKAEEILNNCTLPEFWVEVYNRRHEEDKHIATSLLAANLSANIENSTGIAVIQVNGDSGDGKSHAVLTAAEQMGRWVDVSGMSPMALLYHAGKSIFSGMMVILDDNRPSDRLADVLKRNQTNFKNGYSYKTVAEQDAFLAQIPPGVQIVSTQVDSKDEAEVLNRTLMLEVKGSLERDKNIIRNALERASTGVTPSTDPDIAVCRCCLEKLKSNRYIVTIPDADKRIDWKEMNNGRANVRNFNIFMDLIYAFAVMRYRVRENSTDPNGIIRVTAVRQDFSDALALYMHIHQQMRTKLSSQELKLLQIVSDHGCSISYKDAWKKMDITKSRLSQLINGRNSDGGLSSKCPNFFTEKVSEDSDEGHVGCGSRTTQLYLHLRAPIPQEARAPGLEQVLVAEWKQEA